MTETKPFGMIVLPLIHQVNAFCRDNDLLEIVKVGHVSIKCSSSAVYEARRKDFEDKSTFMYQSLVSDRRVSVIGLKEPLATQIGEIKYVEVSDQKPDNSQIDCIGYIEIVPVSSSYEELVEKLKSKGVEMEERVRSHITTHKIMLPSGFTIRLSKEFLLDKIKREEMV